jgi:hypothetical protein
VHEIPALLGARQRTETHVQLERSRAPHRRAPGVAAGIEERLHRVVAWRAERALAAGTGLEPDGDHTDAGRRERTAEIVGVLGDRSYRGEPCQRRAGQLDLDPGLERHPAAVGE